MKIRKGKSIFSLTTLLLCMVMLHLGVSSVINVSKLISYNCKLMQIKKEQTMATMLNYQLKEDIKKYSSIIGVEEIARNQLGYIGTNEIRIREFITAQHNSRYTNRYF